MGTELITLLLNDPKLSILVTILFCSLIYLYNIYMKAHVKSKILAIYSHIDKIEERHQYELSLLKEQFVRKESLNKMINGFKQALENQTKMMHEEFLKIRDIINEVNIKVERQKVKFESLDK